MRRRLFIAAGSAAVVGLVLGLVLVRLGPSRHRTLPSSLVTPTTTAPTLSTSSDPRSAAAPAAASSTTSQPKIGSLNGRIIAIDPGHNGGNASHPAEVNRLVDAVTLRKPCDTVGAETASGFTEAAFNLALAIRLKAILESAGATVVMTRSDNAGVGPCIT